MKKTLFRRLSALVCSLLTLWTAVITADSDSLRAAVEAAANTSPAQLILRWELGDLFGTDMLTAVNVLALCQSPLLMQQRSTIVPLMAQLITQTPEDEDEPDAPSPPPSTPAVDIKSDDLAFVDNGVPFQTVIPSNPKSYTVAGSAYIKNTSSRTLDAEELSGGSFSARLGAEGPQVLIVHSHATEAYTMPKGQEYDPSGTYRTRDTSCNMVRIGDEVAAVLSDYGISVLHDRTLHDAASYNDAYNSSLQSIKSYLEKYPTLTYVLDLHRDAIQDANGNQYKLITGEDPRVAQCCLVMGLGHDGWKDNLQLAVAVQQQLNALSPTLMRPIAARGYRYNQQMCSGSLLVEIGAAGNSLDEAIMGARYFAKGFAETVLAAAAD